VPAAQDQNAAIYPAEPGMETNHLQEMESNTTGAPLLEASSTPSRCAIPQGWVAYEIRNGDSLELLAAAVNLPIQVLKDANAWLALAYTGLHYLLPSEIPPATTMFAQQQLQITGTPPRTGQNTSCSPTKFAHAQPKKSCAHRRSDCRQLLPMPPFCARRFHLSAVS
jgi:hypothetical protein